MTIFWKLANVLPVTSSQFGLGRVQEWGSSKVVKLHWFILYLTTYYIVITRMYFTTYGILSISKYEKENSISVFS